LLDDITNPRMNGIGERWGEWVLLSIRMMAWKLFNGSLT
jgi:hypothetical protein